MPEETTPALKEPDPSSKTERKLILAGILKSIDKVGPRYMRRKNGKPGLVERIFDGYFTDVTIEDEEGKNHDIRYLGIIHIDSIDNPVKIYRDLTGRIQIDDTEVNSYKKESRKYV